MIKFDYLYMYVILYMIYMYLGSLSVLTNDGGGIIDDCIITRVGPNSFYMVCNAGCADKDLKHLNVSCFL